MTPLAPAEQPTMYFVGVSTGGSSIRRVFQMITEPAHVITNSATIK